MGGKFFSLYPEEVDYKLLFDNYNWYNNFVSFGLNT